MRPDSHTERGNAHLQPPVGDAIPPQEPAGEAAQPRRDTSNRPLGEPASPRRPPSPREARSEKEPRRRFRRRLPPRRPEAAPDSFKRRHGVSFTPHGGADRPSGEKRPCLFDRPPGRRRQDAQPVASLAKMTSRTGGTARTTKFFTSWLAPKASSKLNKRRKNKIEFTRPFDGGDILFPIHRGHS